MWPKVPDRPSLQCRTSQECLRSRSLSVRLVQTSVLGSFVLVAMTALSAFGQAGQMPSQDSTRRSTVVLGFVGGFVRNDDIRHPEVQIIQRLSERKLPALHAAAFENRHTVEAREQIIRWLDTDGDGNLSTEEKQNARVILFGHSWGGSAVIKLARDLDKRGIPVLLTIQVDSVNKGWSDACVIPGNVAHAIDFYQTRGLVHGCRTIRVEDPTRTQIVGSYEFEYTKQPADCSSYPWVDRHFLRTHNAMGCDPRVWSQVENEIQSQLQDDSTRDSRSSSQTALP